MRRHTLTTGLLGAGLILGLAACAQETPKDPETAETAAPAGRSQESGRPGQAVQTLGGAKAGFTLGLPAGWKVVDPATDGSALVRNTFGLTTAPQSELVQEVMKLAQEQGGVYALDPANASGDYAAHLSAVCASAGIAGNSIEDLRRRAEAMGRSLGARNLQIADLTVAGKPALKITHLTDRRDGLTEDVTQIRVPAAGDKSCDLTLTAREGSPVGGLDQIVQGFRPA